MATVDRVYVKGGADNLKRRMFRRGSEYEFICGPPNAQVLITTAKPTQPMEAASMEAAFDAVKDLFPCYSSHKPNSGRIFLSRPNGGWAESICSLPDTKGDIVMLKISYGWIESRKDADGKDEVVWYTKSKFEGPVDSRWYVWKN
jgi:hypothetical protein